MPLALPPEDLEAGNAKPGQRVAHEVRHDAQIFGDDLDAGVAEDRDDLLAKRHLSGLRVGHEACRAAVFRPAVRAVETHEIVDAVAVVEIAMAPRAFPQPSEAVLRDGVPSIHRHAPFLAGGAEGIRRRTQLHVEMELMLTGPDVSAVAVHHERQIAVERDAVRASPRVAPLRMRDPLGVLMKQNLTRQLSTRAGDSGLVMDAQSLRPLGPRPLALRGMDRTEHGVLVDPP